MSSESESAATSGGPAPEQFREVYEHAAQNGLRLTVHAGETVGPESIWGALRELKADRIGHGLHAVDDPASGALSRRAADSGRDLHHEQRADRMLRALEEHPVTQTLRRRRAGHA